MPRLTQRHLYRQRMLADMPQNLNHQHWSYPIYDDVTGMSGFSSCCWKASGLLHPRNRWNSQKRWSEWPGKRVPMKIRIQETRTWDNSYPRQFQPTACRVSKTIDSQKRSATRTGQTIIINTRTHIYFYDNLLWYSFWIIKHTANMFHY